MSETVGSRTPADKHSEEMKRWSDTGRQYDHLIRITNGILADLARQVINSSEFMILCGPLLENLSSQVDILESELMNPAKANQIDVSVWELRIQKLNAIYSSVLSAILAKRVSPALTRQY